MEKTPQKMKKELPDCAEEKMSTNGEVSTAKSKAETPINMCRYVISLLGRKGFFGIESIVQLMLNACKNIPNEKGVFFILTTDTEMPGFLTLDQQLTRYRVNKSMENKDKDAEARWVGGCYILYVGAVGGKGKNKGVGLKRRIRKFIEFGMGKSDDKCGGSYIWLLRCLCPLLVCWIPLPEECDPKDIKRCLIFEFKKHHKRQPYANTANIK